MRKLSCICIFVHDYRNGGSRYKSYVQFTKNRRKCTNTVDIYYLYKKNFKLVEQHHQHDSIRFGWYCFDAGTPDQLRPVVWYGYEKFQIEVI